MKKIIFALTLTCFCITLHAQETEPTNGFGAKLKKSNFHLGIDLQTKYVWRGMGDDDRRCCSCCFSPSELSI